MKKHEIQEINSDSQADDVIYIESMEFVDLGQIYSPHSLHALVSKIETDGVWGHDRFGRLVKYAPNSEKALQALDALEEQYKKEREGFLFGVDGLMDHVGYGWPGSELSKLEPILCEAAKKASERSENNKLIVIAALLEVIAGLTTGEPHPAWGHEKKDISKSHVFRKILQDYYKDRDGKTKEPFGERTLRQIFSDACSALSHRVS